MSVKAKDQTGGDLCKSHTARCDKDFLRVCPSKLSKRELEDVYYSLLENNLELKKAVNSQNEKIRMLNTKVQRMTAQTRTYITSYPKDCCAVAKAVISEQKASISDLKKANDNMAERIRRLNMRLCTAKQFLKRSPYQCTYKCFNCISGTSTSVKNLSTSALNDKTDDTGNLRTVALSAQSVAKVSPAKRTIETNTPEFRNIEKLDTEKVCDENKCRSTMEEFKQKIVDLKEELSKTHAEYSSRMSQLEEQVSALRAARARSLRASDDAELRARTLRDAGAAELEAQLKLERGKVAELEMRLKAAEMSQEVAKTIEKHLSNVSQMEEKQRASRIDSGRCNICMSPLLPSNAVSPNASPTTVKRTELTVPDDKHSKSEDSGYAEHNRDCDKDGSVHSANRELLQRVAHLQGQVDALKLSVDNPDQSPSSIRSKSDFEYYDVNVNDSDVPKLNNVKDYNCVIIDPNKKVILEIPHVNKDSTDKGQDPGLNSPNHETYQLTDSQEPTKGKDYRESILSRQQSRFRSETNQERSSKERRDSVKSTRQKSKEVPEYDEASKRSTDELKQNHFRNNKDSSELNLTDSTIDIHPRTAVPFQQVTLENNDEYLASHHTIYKNEIQDSVSHTRENGVDDNVPQEVKVRCKCPKCNENVEDNPPFVAKRQSHQIGDDIDPSLQCDEEPLDYKKSATKRASHPMFEKEIPQDVSRECMPCPIQTASITDEKIYLKPVKAKLDRHNSLQIPGPLPVDQRDSGGSKVSKASTKSVSLQEKRSIHIKKGGIILDEGVPSRNRQTGVIKEENVGVTKQDGQVTGVLISKTVDDLTGNDRQTVSNYMPINFGDAAVKEIQNQDTDKKLSFEPKVIEVDDYDTATYSRKTNLIKEAPLIEENKLTEDEKRLELCERSAAVCTCPEEDRAMPVLRSCSGTQTFPTLPTSRNFVFRRCACFAGSLSCETKIDRDLSRPRTYKPAEPGRAVPSPAHTYTVPGSPGGKSRSSTPDNTENEISVMTDLPTERDGTTPRDVLSPGEHRATATYTDSYTPGHELSLSEGEVPNGTNYPKRKASVSVGECPGDKRPDDIPYTQESSAQRMEAALLAISQELARCRSLLHSQRPTEQRPSSKDASSGADLTRRESITLRKAEAKPRLSGGLTPKCTFTLHVGTIILSDEAVMNSRDKPLMLTWKFYDQNVTMTRMSAGRVMHFDFSTEYEVKITEEFLEYLKCEEMPITICEIDGDDKSFATCSLPLREALLNANRRADLSLALVAGSTSLSSNVFEATDELGVLDLWCMLRAEPKHLAVINRKTSMISGTSTLNPQQQTLAQIMDDDLSNNYRMSQDLDMHLNKQKLDANVTSSSTDDRDNKKDFYVPETFQRPSPNVTATSLGVHSGRHTSKFSGPSISSDLGMTSLEARQIMARPMAMSPDKAQVGFETYKHHESKPGIIFTEINPKIREVGHDWDTNKENSLITLEGFEKKDRNRRLTTLSCSTNIIDNATINEARKSENWGDTKTQTPATEHEVSKYVPNFTELMASRKKFQDSSLQTDAGKKVTIDPNYKGRHSSDRNSLAPAKEDQILTITVLWLALNEECDAMLDPTVRRLYVAYSFLGKDGADLETPVSLPKPKHYVDKCYYNFKKSFHLTEFDMPILDHMAKCRSHNRTVHNSKDCIVFAVVSEPPEDPLGLDNCVDIGHAFLYLGDLLAYCAGDSFTEVLPVRAARSSGVCGVLAVRLDGLDVVRARA